MKEITWRVPDQMAALFEQMAAHMPEVTLVCQEQQQHGIDENDDIGQRVANAIRELQQNNILRNPCDYTWIMVVIGDGVVKGMGAFRSPQSFMDYLHSVGIEHVPSRSTLSAWYGRVFGKYPNWEFTDTKDQREIMRRKNVGRLFLNAMK